MFIRIIEAFDADVTLSQMLKICLCSRAPQFKKVCVGSEVGSNIDQNEPLWLGFGSFASKLMDRNSIKVFAFEENQSPKNWKTEMG